MPVQVTPIDGSFAAVVEGLDLVAGVGRAETAAVRAALDRHAVVVLPGQHVTDAQQVAFSRGFGPIEPDLRNRQARLGGNEVFDLSNIDKEGRLLDPQDPRAINNRGNQRWHTDSSFKTVPSMASMLSGREVPPEGGETEFADLRAAFDALPDERKSTLRGLIAIHSIAYSRSQLGMDPSKAYVVDLPPVPQALVRRHPASARESLYLGSHASHIQGMPEAEGRALLRELLDFATQPRFVYTHRWRAGDLVIWDNRAVLHRGRPWDETRYRRVMHRTTIAGAGPTIVDGRHAVEVDVVPEAADRLSA